jgi:hypothetical protein
MHFLSVGNSFDGVENMFQRQAQETTNMANGRTGNIVAQEMVSSQMIAFSYIKKHSVRNIFMHDFRQRKPAYEKYLQDCNPQMIALDHTFHIRYTQVSHICYT